MKGPNGWLRQDRGVSAPEGRYPYRNEHAVKRMWGGVEWASWSIGISRYEHRTLDDRCAVREAGLGRSTYVAFVDGVLVRAPTGKPRAFRSQEAAGVAALKIAAASHP